MDRIYVLLIEDDTPFKFDTDALPENQRPSEKHRFIVENVSGLTEINAKEHYHYMVDEGKALVINARLKKGHKIYMSIPWDPREDTPSRTREILDIFDEIEDYVVNKLGEE